MDGWEWTNFRGSGQIIRNPYDSSQLDFDCERVMREGVSEPVMDWLAFRRQFEWPGDWEAAPFEASVARQEHEEAVGNGDHQARKRREGAKYSNAQQHLPNLRVAFNEEESWYRREMKYRWIARERGELTEIARRVSSKEVGSGAVKEPADAPSTEDVPEFSFVQTWEQDRYVYYATMHKNDGTYRTVRETVREGFAAVREGACYSF